MHSQTERERARKPTTHIETRRAEIRDETVSDACESKISYRAHAMMNPL